jgi:hypothetical protein
MRRFLPAVAILIMLSISCAMFREGIQMPKAENKLEIGKNVKKSMGFTMNVTYSLNGSAPTTHSPQYIEIWEKAIIEEGKSSGLFSEVAINNTTSDITAEFEISDKGEANVGLAFLTGLTLYLFPSSATTVETVKATFKNKAGKVLGVYEKKEKNVFWQQILLIFVAPFKWPLSVGKEIKVDLMHAIYKDAADQTIFK